MKRPRPLKLLAVVAGAAAAAGGGLLVRAEAGEAGLPPSQERPDLGLAELLQDEDQRLRVGDTEFIMSDILDFTGFANDLFFWGWLPKISGEVSDNVFIGGQKVEITSAATIGGDLFSVAQTARVDGRVDGDIYAFANDFTVGSGAAVGGAITGAAAVAVLEGTINGPVSFAAGAVRINGTIRGDVEIECGELELGPNAVIEGALHYESAREAVIAGDARVVGEIRHDVPQEDEADAATSASSGGGGRFSVWSLLWDAWWLLSSFLVGAVALAIGGDAARRPAACLAEQPALGLGFGFVVAVVFPAAAVLSMILLVTIPLGLIGFTLYFAAGYLARLVASQTIGDWLLRTARGGVESSPYASLALGLVLFHFLTQIPYVGFLIWLAAIVGGFGGIFLATRSGKSEIIPPAPQPATVP